MCRCEQEVLDLAPAALRLPPGECELLYGRAGYLYALLFLRKHLGPSAVDPDLVNIPACITGASRATPATRSHLQGGS